MEKINPSNRINNKRILIITYYWPPSGGPGVLRWLNFSDKLTKQFEVFILTTQNGDYPLLDNSLNKKINPNISVYKEKTMSLKNIAEKFIKKNESLPYGSLEINNNDSFLKKMMLFIRINFVIPDSRVVWNYNAIRKAKKIILKHNIDIIITTGPPSSSHLIGLYLKRKIDKIKWIADFRDPWTDAFWITSIKRLKISQKIDKYFEKSVLNTADQIFTVSNSIKKLLIKKNINLKIKIFNNGLKELNKPSFSNNEIIFFGNLTKYQNSIPLFEAIKNIKNNKIKIIFIGKQPQNFIEILHQYKELSIHTLPYLPYDELMEKTKHSLAFFLPYVNSGNYTDGIIGTKFFDYAHQQKPIIALGNLNSSTKDIMLKYNIGFFHDYKDIEGITKSINKILLKKQNNEFWEYSKEFKNLRIENIVNEISKTIKDL